MANIQSNRICPVEMAGALESPFRRLVQNPVKILKPYLKPGDKVLEFGCGPGYFTLDIARLIGEKGLVYASDLQEGMLEKVINKIAKANMHNRIHVHKCERSGINLKDTVDFILAFYVIHEVVDQNDTFNEFKQLLNPDGRLLIIEPNFHVSKIDFHEMILNLENTGFRIIEKPKIFLSRSVLLEKIN